MQPRDRLTAKEIQVATLVWQGLTNKDIAGVLLTSEQVVKNYLRTAFDKLGVWTRLELALYVAGHGGANWHMQLGNGLLPPGAGWSVAQGGNLSFRGARSTQGSAQRSAYRSPYRQKKSPPQAEGSCREAAVRTTGFASYWIFRTR